MKNVPFDSRLVTRGDKKVVAQIIHCARKECREQLEIYSSKSTKILPPSLLNRKIQQHDWGIVSHEAYCPKHKPSSPGRRRVTQSVDANVVFANFAPISVPTGPSGAMVAPISPPPAPPPPAPPKEIEPVTNAVINDLKDLAEVTTPDAATKRRIFRTVDEHWDEPKGRYETLWSDQRIATDLKVPRLWVEDIRRDAFGANGGNAELDALRTDMEAAEKRFAEMTAEAARRLDAAMTACAGLEKALLDLKELRKRVERVEVAILPRR